MSSPQYFTKVTTDTNHELFSWLNEKPLRWAVLMTISARVASKDQVTTGLSKGEFFISETEYKKFGLSLSERGKLRRTIFELVEVKIIEKIENKNGNKNCAVYRFLDSDFIDCSRENREQNREQIENRQRTDREQIETNKECKSDKNERMKEDNYREGGEENKNTLSVDKPPTRTGISFHSFEKSIHAKDEMYVFIVERCRAHYKFDTFIVERELQKFYDYWTEKSPTAKKSRWEKETVFDVNRRIATWMSRVSLSEKDLEEIEKAKVLRKLAQSEKLLNEQKI